ncbi:MAG: AAA domain-containing protein [Patescibacteria group bacterium]
MKKIIIYGPSGHIFTEIIKEKIVKEGALAIIEDWKELITKLPEEEADILVLINKTEKEALAIKNQIPTLRVIMCRGGGEKEWQPIITLIDAQKNHERLTFANWDDFWQKLKSQPINPKPLLSSLPEDDHYRVNYQNYPELEKSQKAYVNQKFFWFSVYYSRIYLWWFKKWFEEVMKMGFNWNVKIIGQGKVKKIIIPFANKYQGELIFRDGESIIFCRSGVNEETYGEYYRRLDFEYKYENEHEKASDLQIRQAFEEEEANRGYKIIGTIISADEEALEVQLKKPVDKDVMRGIRSFRKGGGLLGPTIEAYSKCCAGYSDLSLKDYIYSTREHYDKPEDFLRGYIPNSNKTHLTIPTVKLDGRSKIILQDESQIKALMEMIGPSFLTTVKGPPGTGKTLLTAVAIKQFVLAGKIIVVATHSNKGLDNLVETLAEHIDTKRIFRLGNDPDLIISAKAIRYHRSQRYKKQTMEIKDKDKVRETEISLENEALWQLICAGEGIVIATTINSFQFDRSLSRLFLQNDLISNNEFRERETHYDLIPKSVIKFMDGDIKKIKPQFMVDVVMVDEATKGRFFEFVPLIKAATSKLILIGDTDQLGNISITLDAQEDMKKKIMEGLTSGGHSSKEYLYSTLKSESHSLPPMETTAEEAMRWFESFSQGTFYSLSENSEIKNSELNINRRSLEIPVKFINFVFQKNLQIGRFSPYTQGEVIFLNAVGNNEQRAKTSYKNNREKVIANQEVMSFFRQQKKRDGKVNLEALGVITTYRGQIKIIKESLRGDLLFHPLFEGLVNPKNIDHVLKMMVNTVDAFQGSEKDQIIVSLVRANKDGQIGFNNDIRRLYVAFSRLKSRMVIIGNQETFLKSKEKKVRKIFGRMIKFTQDHKTYSVK